MTETLEDFRCYLTACDAAATAACCGGATCATVEDAACCRRSVWARGGGDYAWVPHEALRCVDRACRAEGFGPHCDEACAPYVTGRWCTRRVAADAVLAPRAHLSDDDYDARLSRACRDPEGVVVDRRGRVVPRLHAEAHGNALGSCVASLADDVVFVGDSQTKMMRFEYARWLDGGRREPYGIAVDEFGPAPGAFSPKPPPAPEPPGQDDGASGEPSSAPPGQTDSLSSSRSSASSAPSKEERRASSLPQACARRPRPSWPCSTRAPI